MRRRGLRRKTPLRAQEKPARARDGAGPATDSAAVREAQAAFRAQIRGERCVVCGRSEREACEETGWGHQAHHAVRKEILKRLHLLDYLWDPRNAVCVCEEPCHRRHTSRMVRIDPLKLPQRVFDFVQALGLQLEFEREYPAVEKSES